MQRTLCRPASPASCLKAMSARTALHVARRVLAPVLPADLDGADR